MEDQRRLKPDADAARAASLSVSLANAVTGRDILSRALQT